MAKIIAANPNLNERELICTSFAKLAREFNPRFDYNRFRAACGLD
jgi:hypothetical protein